MDVGAEKDEVEEGSSRSRVCTTRVIKTEISHTTNKQNLKGEVSSSKPVSLQVKKIPIDQGVKHYGHRMRLYCRTGFCIMILSDGKVRGDKLGEHPAGILEFTSAGIGEVRIRGVHSNLYLSMTNTGNLCGQEDPRDYATVFVEGTYGQYNTYLSQKYAHMGWYVGIKKNGTIKRGPLTKWGQKAIQFLPLRS